MASDTSVFDRVRAVLQKGGTYDQLSKIVEQDVATTRQLSMEIAAVLIAGSARRLANGGRQVVGVFTGADSALLDLDNPISAVDPSAGAQDVSGMLGDKSGAYTAGLAEVNNVGIRQVESLMNRLAPIVAAAVKAQQELRGLDRRQLALDLRQERDRVTNLGLLSWSPHQGRTSPERSVVDRGRNVAKIRPLIEADTTTIIEVSRRRQPVWLWWSLGIILLVLLVAWILSQAI